MTKKYYLQTIKPKEGKGEYEIMKCKNPDVASAVARFLSHLLVSLRDSPNGSTNDDKETFPLKGIPGQASLLSVEVSVGLSDPLPNAGTLPERKSDRQEFTRAWLFSFLFTG